MNVSSHVALSNIDEKLGEKLAGIVRDSHSCRVTYEPQTFSRAFAFSSYAILIDAKNGIIKQNYIAKIKYRAFTSNMGYF